MRKYDPTNLHSEGTMRGQVLFKLLSGHGIPLTTGHLLDLGCGYGGYTLHAARSGAHVTAVDYDDHKLRSLKDRITGEQTIQPERIRLLKANITDLPFADEHFDQALTIGVIEWVPLTSPGMGPREAQVRALGEIARVLKPGGTYVLGTKNRWYPMYALREPQMRWPLVDYLPRRAADVCARLISGGKYRTHIHSLEGWRKMLSEAGFSSIKAFLPVYFYQFPLALWPADGRAHSLSRALNGSASAVAPEYLSAAQVGRSGLKRVFLSGVVAARMERLLWPAFVLAATK